MHLILCHTTADFDTLGAAIGLSRLLPGSRIVLTGGAHPTVQNFLALHRDEYALIERRSVTPAQIRSLTVVDTQQRDRLGKAAEWLDLPIEITVYDHHLALEGDIPATRRYLDAIGATTTLIVEQLRAAAIVPTASEATAMALGIHADTGSLTFDQTTARDARAIAWLLEQGASLRTIAEYADPGLSPLQQQYLSKALEKLQSETVQGHTIAAVRLEVAAFVPGLSSVAAQLMEVTGLDALLLAAVARSDQHPTLTIIGRSRIEGTDLNALLQPIGGGGHPRAAAAHLHTVTPDDTLAQLMTQFKAQIPPPAIARELMSAPVRTIRPQTTIAEAQRVLLRYGHSGLSVVDAADRLVGIISRRDLDIALHHGFSHAPVKGYMTTNLKTIAPETTLPEIESLMVTYDIGRLPVLEQGQLVGIVTRTDVLRQWQRRDRGPANPQNSKLKTQTPNLLLSELQRCLRPELWQVLTIAAQQAEKQGWHLYLVGGAVRDLLRAIAQAETQPGALLIQDVDLVVDGFHRSVEAGAGVELARSLQAQHPKTRLEIHGKFQTAALLWHHDPLLGSLWVDIATARTEFYPYPAANPEVEASSIQQDLYRRDFTINALAIRLTNPRAGEILDFFGGMLDLQAGQVRVLHANSFIEDPTRIYRAVRFAVRLGFAIEPQTEGYICHAIASGIYEQVYQSEAGDRRSVPALQTRLRSELKYLLQTPYWKPALQKLADLQALRCIHPTLTLDRDGWRQLRLAERWLSWTKRQTPSSPPPNSPPPNSPPPNSPPPNSTLNTQHSSAWLLLLEVLLARLEPDDRGKVAETLQLPAESGERLRSLALTEAAIGQGLPERPSQVVRRLKRYDRELLVLVAIRSDRPVRRQIWRYLTDWSIVKPWLTGRDLKALGYRPGPQFKQILETLTDATLDGLIHDRADAIARLPSELGN